MRVGQITKRIAGGLLIALVSAQAAEFRSGQAARAVIGQPSFTAHDAGVAAYALVLAKDKLHAAEGNRILTFDVSRIPQARDEFAGAGSGSCAVCGFAALSTANQSVVPGVAAVAVFGKTVVIADAANRRVLIWRGADTGSIGPPQPDVVLGRTARGIFADPISVAYDGKRLFVGDAGWHRVLVWKSLPAVDDQPPDAVLGQPDFSSRAESETPGAATLSAPSALASDGTNLYVADSVDRRILVFTPADTALASDAVVNSATLQASPLGPGTLVSIKGAGLSDFAESAQQSAEDSLPLTLGNAEVYLNGARLPLLSVSAEEIEAQLPYDFGKAAGGSLYIRTLHDNGAVTVTNPVAVRFAAVSPGIFAFGGKEPRSGLLLHATGDETRGAGSPVTGESPAHAGEVVTVWAAGLGLVNDSGGTGLKAGVPYDASEGNVLTPVEALVNGEPAEVVSAKLPSGAVGVYEVRVLLPTGVTDQQSAHLTLIQNGISSNTVTFPAGSPAN